MQAIVDQIKAKAQELLAAGTVDRVLGWKRASWHTTAPRPYSARQKRWTA